MAKQEKINPEELRYNYLGFDVVPGKIKEFWASEEEKKQYIEKVRAAAGTSHVIERDFSMVNAKLLNKADRIIISLASALMLLSLFLPYYNFMAFGDTVRGSAIGLLFNISYIGNFVAWGSLVMKLTLILAVIMIIISPLVGVVNLIALNTGLKGQRYFERLKKAGKLNIVALALYLLLFILVMTGQSNPFGSLGIEALGDRFTFLSLINLTSFSLWLNIGAHFLGMIPAMEL
jgi:hypothetical protein